MYGLDLCLTLVGVCLSVVTFSVSCAGLAPPSVMTNEAPILTKSITAISIGHLVTLLACMAAMAAIKIYHGEESSVAVYLVAFHSPVWILPSVLGFRTRTRQDAYRLVSLLNASLFAVLSAVAILAKESNNIEKGKESALFGAFCAILAISLAELIVSLSGVAVASTIIKSKKGTVTPAHV